MGMYFDYRLMDAQGGIALPKELVGESEEVVFGISDTDDTPQARSLYVFLNHELNYYNVQREVCHKAPIDSEGRIVVPKALRRWLIGPKDRPVWLLIGKQTEKTLVLTTPRTVLEADEDELIEDESQLIQNALRKTGFTFQKIKECVINVLGDV